MVINYFSELMRAIEVPSKQIVTGWILLAACSCSSLPDTGALDSGVIEKAAGRELRFTVVVNVDGFENGSMPGYHAIVFRGGGAAASSLFVAGVTDVHVLDALESLGTRPGPGLSMETWDARNEPANPAPEAVILGPAVEILVVLPHGDGPEPLSSFLMDGGGRGLQMRLGGNRENISIWHSGCVVCLYSCPGSKIGNAAYSVRDWVRGTTRFRVKPGSLPSDGSNVEIVLRLVDAMEPA
jgi:hypothetical protein